MKPPMARGPTSIRIATMNPSAVLAFINACVSMRSEKQGGRRTIAKIVSQSRLLLPALRKVAVRSAHRRIAA